MIIRCQGSSKLARVYQWAMPCKAHQTQKCNRPTITIRPSGASNFHGLNVSTVITCAFMEWCLMVALSFKYSNIIYDMYIQDMGQLKMDEEWLMWRPTIGPRPHLVAQGHQKSQLPTLEIELPDISLAQSKYCYGVLGTQ